MLNLLTRQCSVPCVLAGLLVAVALFAPAMASGRDAFAQRVPALVELGLDTAVPAARAVSVSGCQTPYSSSVWIVELCPTDPSVTAQMRVVMDGVDQGLAVSVAIYHKAQGYAGIPQVAVLYSSGYVRLRPNMDPSPAMPFGSSFIMGPAYWSGGAYNHNPTITRVEIDTTGLPDGPLRLLALGANRDFAVTYQLTLPPPSDDLTRLHVTQTYTATTGISIDTARRSTKEGLKLVQVSSMFINQGGACDGGKADCHDSNAARFIGSDLQRHEKAFTGLTLPSFVFSSTLPLGIPWLDVLHTDDQGWQGNTPNVRIALDPPPYGRTVTPQGWISVTTDPNDDNAGLWLHDDGPASVSWATGASDQVSYWLTAQDNPPEPWSDRGLRPGLTILDFEGVYDCRFEQQVGVTGTVGLIPGYTGKALEMSYGLGSTTGNWAQTRCDFNPPLDLSVYDHLRLEWRGQASVSNTLQVNLITLDGATPQFFGHGFKAATQRGWWGQLIIPFRMLGAWTAGTTLNPARVSSLLVAVKKDDAGDAGGPGLLAIDNVGALNAVSRTVPTSFEPVAGGAQAAAAAAAWIASQQQPNGLVKSWQEESACLSYTYDQALALMVFSHRKMWQQADAVAQALAQAQNGDGSWPRARNCQTGAVADGTPWEGDIAWAIYGLRRYLALGGTRPEAATALGQGAAWLATRISPADGCLVIDHTEATIDAWWAMQAAGLSYAGQAGQLQACLMNSYWDEAMGRFKGGKDYWQPFLDNQTWGAAFLKATGEEVRARRALSYARLVLAVPAQGGQVWGFDGQGGPWSVWNEGAGQYVAAGGQGSQVLLGELLAQQRSDGAVPGSPDDFSGAGVWTTRWHGIAPTAWLYFALNGEPFRKPLTITADARSKTYGDAVTFAGTEFIASGLVNSDTVTSVTLTSAGAAITATTAGSPYPIVPSAAVGAGLGNYTTSYTDGPLTVARKALTITADARSKTYGDAVIFAGTEFIASGLVNSDTVTSVTLTSAGAAATATTAGSPYPIVPGAAVGTGLSNYSISYIDGALTVAPRWVFLPRLARNGP